MGCFPTDKIPPCRHHPCSMVINYDDSTEPGSHWIAIYAPMKEVAFFFDSLGLDGTEEIQSYLRTYYPTVHRFYRNIQKPTSKVCGQYAIFFIHMAALGYTVHGIRRILVRSRNADKFVATFVNKLHSNRHNKHRIDRTRKERSVFKSRRPKHQFTYGLVGKKGYV